MVRRSTPDASYAPTGLSPLHGPDFPRLTPWATFLRGNGPTRLRLPLRYNRLLKDVILGAAKSVIAAKDGNPFADQYRRHLEMGQSPRVARRNVARSMAAVMWGMRKSGGAYDPRMAGARPAAGESRLTGAGRAR